MSAPIAHGGAIAAAAARFGGRPEDWLDLSTGINPCPPALPEMPARAWHRLPDQELVEAARLSARGFYHSGERLPLPVPGTQSVIQLLPRLVDASRRVAILTPTYGEYARAFERNGFVVDTVGSLDAIGEAHGLAVVVNPNNPDGRSFDAATLEALARRMANSGALLVVDEAFGDGSSGNSLAGRPLTNLIVFRSFGKFFGMAGIRLGFVIADDGVLARFSDWLGPWAVSGPALSIATSLLSGDTAAISDRIAERRQGLGHVLDRSGLMVIGGTGLFALVDHSDAPRLHAHLCRHHILTRAFDYAPNWLRFGLAADASGDARLAAALAQWSGD